MRIVFYQGIPSRNSSKLWVCGPYTHCRNLSNSKYQFAAGLVINVIKDYITKHHTDFYGKLLRSNIGFYHVSYGRIAVLVLSVLPYSEF